MPCFTDVFRECGGARCVHGMVQYEACRQQALSIIQQLILSPQGDDDMATLLGLMHTSPVLSLKLKTHILKVLMLVHFLFVSQTQNSHIQNIEICAFLFVSKTQNIDLLSNLFNSHAWRNIDVVFSVCMIPKSCNSRPCFQYSEKVIEPELCSEKSMDLCMWCLSCSQWRAPFWIHPRAHGTQVGLCTLPFSKSKLFLLHF